MRSWPFHCALVSVAVVAAGCVQHGCPKGTKDLAGACISPNTSDAGDQARNAIEGNGGADAGASSEPRDTEATNRDNGQPAVNASSDAGATDTEVADAGATNADVTDGALTVDAMAVEPTPTCDDLTCGVNAHCEMNGETPVCSCNDGYIGDAQMGCVDDDECTTGKNDCSKNAVCSNEPGSYSCACNPGFDGDGTTCKANPCEARVNPCDLRTTTCRDDKGSAACDCVANHDRCDGDPLACTTDVTTDRYNCGSCDLICAGTLACVDAACDQPATALALGSSHSCALKANGEVWCWGDNQLLELGAATTGSWQSTPVKADIASVAKLDAGELRTCAITESRRLVCWGFEQLILGMTGTDSSGYVDVSTTSVPLPEISVGGAAACTLDSPLVHCWGLNSQKALGTTGASEGSLVSFNSGINTRFADPVSFDVGARMSCVVTGGGHVSCWGGSASPALHTIEKADGSPLSGVSKVAVSLAQETSSIVDSACALTDGGNVWCWGNNAQGQLGNPATTASSSNGAVAVTDSQGFPAENVVEVAVGGYHACVRQADGMVACWGRTDMLGSGRAGTSIRRSPVEVKDLTDAIELKAGTTHTCVRRRTGQVQCWGANSSGQLGVDPTAIPTSNVPVDVTDMPSP